MAPPLNDVTLGHLRIMVLEYVYNPVLLTNQLYIVMVLMVRGGETDSICSQKRAATGSPLFLTPACSILNLDNKGNGLAIRRLISCMTGFFSPWLPRKRILDAKMSR